MDSFITIKLKAETQNSRGDPIAGAPSAFATIWAEYEELSGSEGLAGDQKAFASATGHWKTRYLAGVLNTMEIDEGGVLFDIVHVDESRIRDGELHIYTTRRAA